MGWLVNTTPRPLYPRERLSIHCIWGWVDPRAGLDGFGISHPTGIRSPTRPARRESLYRLSYPGPLYIYIYIYVYYMPKCAAVTICPVNGFGFQLTSLTPHITKRRRLLYVMLSVFSSSTPCRYVTLCHVINIYPYFVLSHCVHTLENRWQREPQVVPKHQSILTCSMERFASWEANWPSASQEIPHILRDQKVHYCIHKCSQHVLILIQIDPVHAP